MVSPLIERLTTCVVGGGNSAHVLVPFLSEARHSVNLLTRRPQDWNHDSITCQLTDGTTGQVAATHVGMLAACSANPADVVPNADIVILCMPVHSYREALDRIAPYLSRSKSHVYVGTMYGQAGFNWMVHAMEREFGLTNIVAFACGSIPWVCRYVNLFMRPAMALTSKDLLASQHNLFVDSTVKYGELVANYGGKHVNVAAVTPHSQFDKLNRVLLQNLSVRPLGMGAFRQAESFLSLTLSVDNQIIHPARCYGLWKKYGGYWKDEAHVPYFYRDFDHTSETILQALDRDYAAVRSAVRRSFPSKQFPYMLDYFSLEKLNHNSSHAGILATFRDSPQLVCIKTPTVPSGSGSQNQSAARVLDTNCRFFTDDIPYGLLVAKRLAELLEQPVPMIDEVLLWAQTLRGEHFVHEKDGSVDLEFCLQRQGKLAVCGIPETYGITKIEDMLD